MFNNDKKTCLLTLENNGLKAVIDYKKGEFVEFSNKYTRHTSNTHRELFVLKIYGKTFTSKDFELKSVNCFKDETEEMLSLHYLNKKEKLGVKLHLISDFKDTIRVLYQVADSFKDGLPHEMLMKVPLFHEIEIDGKDKDTILPPGCQFRNKDGKKIIMPLRDYQYVSDIRPSMAVLGKNRKLGFAIHFPTFSDLNNYLTTQNVNKMLAMLETEDKIRNEWMYLSADKSYNDTVELHITAVRKGWAEVFDRYRDYWASFYDFSEYDREDLKWFNEKAVHNFVFFYGKEGFDHKKMKIDTQKLIKDGKEFGGYDTVTIWNMYPRLGIDKRNQWDFYDDFPGGRKALRKAVDEFHKEGIEVFLPYIPWDQGPTETTESMGDEFARITKDTDADGWQLDTMYDLPLSFRQKLDKVRKGLVLTSQFHPTKKLPIEMITTSWNEFWQLDPMPEVDVLRFLCPIHIAPQIGRWLRYEDKTKLINRAAFGGAPIVIWQDIFGKWLPYGKDQKKMVKTWKKVYLKYRDIFQGDKPIPIYTTSKDDLYCNVFINNEETASIYSFYNDTDKPITGTCELWKDTGNKCKIILGNGKAELNKNRLKVTVPSRTVVQVLINK